MREPYYVSKSNPSPLPVQNDWSCQLRESNLSFTNVVSKASPLRSIAAALGCLQHASKQHGIRRDQVRQHRHDHHRPRHHHLRRRCCPRPPHAHRPSTPRPFSHRYRGARRRITSWPYALRPKSAVDKPQSPKLGVLFGFGGLGQALGKVGNAAAPAPCEPPPQLSLGEMLSERVPKRDHCGPDIPEANEPYCWRPYAGNIATCLGGSVPEALLIKPWQAR